MWMATYPIRVNQIRTVILLVWIILAQSRSLWEFGRVSNQPCSFRMSNLQIFGRRPQLGHQLWALSRLCQSLLLCRQLHGPRKEGEGPRPNHQWLSERQSRRHRRLWNDESQWNVRGLLVFGGSLPSTATSTSRLSKGFSFN